MNLDNRRRQQYSINKYAGSKHAILLFTSGNVTKTYQMRMRNISGHITHTHTSTHCVCMRENFFLKLKFNFTVFFFDSFRVPAFLF